MSQGLDARQAGGAFAVAALGVAVALGLGACTPGTDISAAESDVITSQYDTEFDFAALTDFSMPDSVLHMTDDGEDDPNLSRANDAAVLAQVAQNFIDLGYSRVAFDTTFGASIPSFVALVTASSSDFYYANWGCGGYYYWYYPGYCWGYPSASHAYTTGTLIVQMFDPASADSALETIEVPWRGAMNGVLTSSGTADRITRGIDQMFEQSPYLGTSQ